MSPQPGYLGPPQQVPPRPRPRPGQGGGMSVSDVMSKYGVTPQMGGPAGGGGGVPGGGQGMPPAPGGNMPPGGAPPNPNPGPYPPGGGRPMAPGQGPRTPQGQRPGGLAGSVNPNNTGDAWQQWKAKNSMQPVQQPGVRPDGSYPGPIVDGKQTYIKDGKVVGYEDMPNPGMPGFNPGGASPGGMQFMPYGGMEYSQYGQQGY